MPYRLEVSAARRNRALSSFRVCKYTKISKNSKTSAQLLRFFVKYLPLHYRNRHYVRQDRRRYCAYADSRNRSKGASCTCWRCSARRSVSSPHRRRSWRGGPHCAATWRSGSCGARASRRPSAKRPIAFATAWAPWLPTDGAYPSLLRETPDYPHIIYVKGDPAVLAGPCVSVVGTRDASAYGQKMCARIVHELVERVPGVCIVSGLAFGIDAAARIVRPLRPEARPRPCCPARCRTSCRHSTRPLAREILERGGALVTELHSQVKQKGAFTWRATASSQGSPRARSSWSRACGGGSLMTAHCADGYGRSVMAVPGRADDPSSRGANLLIRNHKQGATRAPRPQTWWRS